jgi:RND family efflux transporter MFP subunit
VSMPRAAVIAHGACALTCVGLLAGCGGRASSETAEEPQQTAAIQTAQVSRGAVEETIETLGTVEFDPGRLHTLTLTAGGKVLEVRVVAGQMVRRGDVLLTLGPLPVDSVEVQRAKLDAEYAAKGLARTRRLLEEKLATNQEVANAEKELETARVVLRSLGEGGTGAATELKAPAEGIVAQVLVNRGQIVPAGREAAQLAPRDALAVAVGFESEDVPRLAEGQRVVIAPVSASATQAPVRAKLSRLHRTVDPSTQLVQGLIQLPDPPAWIASGMKVDVRAVVRQAPDAVRVPRLALVERDGRPGVFVIEQGHARFRALTLGIEGDDCVEVREGLAAGEVVATTGRSSLADGMAVRTGAERP